MPVREHLSDNGVEIEDYERIESYLSRLGRGYNPVDPQRVNSWLYDSIGREARIEGDTAITTILKAVKNQVEIENLKKAHIKDGVAMVKFLCWLDNNLSRRKSQRLL